MIMLVQCADTKQSLIYMPMKTQAQVQTHTQTDGWTDKQTDKWPDRQRHARMHTYIYIHRHNYPPPHGLP